MSLWPYGWLKVDESTTKPVCLLFRDNLVIISVMHSTEWISHGWMDDINEEQFYLNICIRIAYWA